MTEMDRERRQKAKQERREKRQSEEAMKREEEKKARALVVQPRPEILPPASRVPALPALDLEAMQLPDLSNLKQQIRNAAEMLDLSVPEGLLDKWFGRPDHRIEVKTERGPLLAGYVIACTAVWEAARAHQNTCHQIYLDRLLFQRRVAEEQCQFELTRRRANRQDENEAAQ